MITEKAHAKINLALDVLGRRPNGYHEVRMIMQTVQLCDTLTFEKAERGITIRLVEDGLEAGRDPAVLPLDENNLIYRAAGALMEHCTDRWSGDKSGSAPGVNITLEKHIPIAAGMAGGSSDAAATLRGLNRLFELKLTQEELCDIGVTIGADVPYCICGGTMLAEGIGEKLTGLKSVPELTLAIAKPARGVSTKYVYETLDTIAGWKTAEPTAAEPFHAETADPAETAATGPSVPLHHPDIDGMLSSIETGSADGILSRLGNVLEQVTIPACPEVARIKEVFRAQGARGVLMSGSGPTVFAVFDSAKQAEDAIMEIRKAGLAGPGESLVTHTCSTK